MNQGNADMIDFSSETSESDVSDTMSASSSWIPAACHDKFFPAGFVPELKATLQLAWPILVTQVLQMLIGPVALIFCGHLSTIELDAVALANTMINVLTISVATGLATACDTLFAQMYWSWTQAAVACRPNYPPVPATNNITKLIVFCWREIQQHTYGSYNKKRVGLYVQRGLIIMLLSVMPCIAVLINIEGFLRVIGQHPDVSRLSAEYLLYFIPGAVCFFAYSVLAKYVQTQNIAVPVMIVCIISNALNAILHYLVVYVFDWGTGGSAACQSISYFVMFLLMLLYILCSKVYVDTWEGWTWECFQDWGQFLKLAIPGMLMICIEWWSYEIGVFLTGILGVVDLAAQSVLFQITNICYNIPSGIAIACSVRVGQHLGSKNAKHAKTASYVALTLTVISGITVAVLILALRFQLPGIFTSDSEVVSLSAALLPISALYTFFDNIACVCQGVFRGSGRQAIGAILMALFYYVIALPLGIPLMFLTPLRAAGLWWAFAGTLLLESTTFYIIVARTNWPKEAQEAQERAGADIPDTIAEEEETGVPKDYDSTEHTALLPKRPRFTSLDSEAGHSSIDSGVDTYISGARRRRRRRSTISLSRYTPAVTMDDEDLQTVPLTKNELIFRRTLAFVIILGILAIGIFLRVTIKLPPIETDGKSTTVPMNSSTLSADMTHSTFRPRTFTGSL